MWSVSKKVWKGLVDRFSKPTLPPDRLPVAIYYHGVRYVRDKNQQS